MKKSPRIFYFYLYFLFLVISSVSNYIAFANDGYKLEQTNQLSDVEKGVFIDAFMDNYKNIPHNLCKIIILVLNQVIAEVVL